jgi:hypothetical protein
LLFVITRLLFVLILSSGNANLFAQWGTLPIAKKPPIRTKAQRDRDVINEGCVHKNKISKEKRSKIFPFNKATKIQLVSFQRPDSFKFTYLLPTKGKTVDYSRLSEVITLTGSAIDSLTDILYNYGFKGVFYSYSESSCIYNPANAILFLDKKDSVFAFIEICFQCWAYRVSNKKINLGDECTDKYELVKNFFLKNGIRLGTMTD